MQNTCKFCGRTAIVKNPQGFPTCLEHKNTTTKENTCSCGNKLELKHGKWGPFYVCPSCGPISARKAENMDTSGYKLNKSFREKSSAKRSYKSAEKTQTTKTHRFQKENKEKKEKIYTLEELEMLWD